MVYHREPFSIRLFRSSFLLCLANFNSISSFLNVERIAAVVHSTRTHCIQYYCFYTYTNSRISTRRKFVCVGLSKSWRALYANLIHLCIVQLRACICKYLGMHTHTEKKVGKKRNKNYTNYEAYEIKCNEYDIICFQFQTWYRLVRCAK